LRIDGVLAEIGSLPRLTFKKLISRFKIISHLKLNVTNLPQDGSFGLTLNGEIVDFRISILPSVHHEGAVIRILRQNHSVNIDSLGLVGRARQNLEEVLHKTNGLILSTGPTGSGKTTTLYAILKKINRPGVKAITIEDPVEYKMDNVSQTSIDKAAGLTFASALKAMLRQDPDVVMVGEIRDHETAETAIQAALTGHVVLSTLHTNDAPSTIARLVDLDIKPFLIVGAINIIMAQRLVRKLCQQCRQEFVPDAELMQRAVSLLETIPASSGISLPSDKKFYTSKGCAACANLGYKGRIGIYEVLSMTPALETLILREASISALRQQAVSDGMLTMAQDGVLKALDGTTDIYEVFRVVD
jgi:type II secretory ATPase GspE/PulE/Tfp pilus assembly ATPase PilB-like protein